MVDALFFAWQMTALLSCVLAGGAMLTFFYKYTRTRAHPGPVLLCIFLATIITNIARVALHVWRSPSSSSSSSSVPVTLSAVANCELGADLPLLEDYEPFFFWCAFFFLTAATMWYLMLALDLIFSLSNPFLPFNADNLKHHVFAWPAALLYCVVFRYAFQNSNGHASKYILLYFHLPAYLVLLYISGALMISWRRSRLLEFHAHKTTRRMAKLILPYLAVFAAYTVVSFVLCMIQASTERDTTTANAVDQLALVLESLALFVLFCRDAGVFQAFHDKAYTQLPVSRTMSQVDMGGHDTDRLDVSNKLRKDVMKYTSMGIIESIKLWQGHPVDERDFTVDDYNQVESMRIRIHGEIDSALLSFQDCAPRVFQSIRTHFKIDPQFMLDSFALDKILSEHGSEGKSGNIFYFTANKQFMVKSVPKEEYDTLRAILPRYHEYLRSNPESMLCRYFGCYSISLPVGKRRMFFVVMQNLFNEGPVHQRYDLKGNCDRRQAINARDVEKHIQLARQRKVIGTLMMDIDFRKLSAGLAVAPAKAEALQGILCDDMIFLASNQIIDYSLLVGVRHLHDAEPLPPLQHDGACGVHSINTDNVYYMGVIDMLQRYNWRWTLQRWFLGLICKDTQDVSAVPPGLYASRLEDFVRSPLFDIPGPSGNGSSRSSNHNNPPQQQQHRAVHHDGGKAGGNSSAQSRVLKMEMDQFHPATFLPDVPLSPSYSIDGSSIYRPSSSSPSVAYSSVCQSPVSRASSRDPTLIQQQQQHQQHADQAGGRKSGKKPAFFI